jgi:hypothetical protein
MAKIVVLSPPKYFKKVNDKYGYTLMKAFIEKAEMQQSLQ